MDIRHVIELVVAFLLIAGSAYYFGGHDKLDRYTKKGNGVLHTGKEVEYGLVLDWGYLNAGDVVEQASLCAIMLIRDDKRLNPDENYVTGLYKYDEFLGHHAFGVVRVHAQLFDATKAYYDLWEKKDA